MPWVDIANMLIQEQFLLSLVYNPFRRAIQFAYTLNHKGGGATKGDCSIPS